MSTQTTKSHNGAGHWMQERITSLLLVPLNLWIIWSIIELKKVAAFSHVDFILWLQNPLNAGLLLLTLIVTFHHAVLGLQVVIDDYISSPSSNLFASRLVKAVFILLTFVSIVSIFQIAF